VILLRLEILRKAFDQLLRQLDLLRPQFYFLCDFSIPLDFAALKWLGRHKVYTIG
jgi:hypothetical protein